MGGSMLEELVGTLDASCTKLTLQCGTLQGQQAAQCSSSPDEEKSIVPVSAIKSHHMTCITVTHQARNPQGASEPDCSVLYPAYSSSVHHLCSSLHIPMSIRHSRSLQQHRILGMLQAARPKLEMELPYRMYHLVKADGMLCERIEKHPFQMSRQASARPVNHPCFGLRLMSRMSYTVLPYFSWQGQIEGCMRLQPMNTLQEPVWRKHIK